MCEYHTTPLNLGLVDVSNAVGCSGHRVDQRCSFYCPKSESPGKQKLAAVFVSRVENFDRSFLSTLYIMQQERGVGKIRSCHKPREVS